jgi:hypothetical protein
MEKLRKIAGRRAEHVFVFGKSTSEIPLDMAHMIPDTK